MRVERALHPHRPRHRLDGQAAARRRRRQRRGVRRPGARRRERVARAGCARSDRRSARIAPSVAIDAASWRAASQFTGPCCCSIRARSPNKRDALERVFALRTEWTVIAHVGMVGRCRRSSSAAPPMRSDAGCGRCSTSPKPSIGSSRSAPTARRRSEGVARRRFGGHPPRRRRGRDPHAARRRRRHRCHDDRAAVERDRVRGVADQPGAAHRGRAAASEHRPRVRGASSRARAAGGRVEGRPSRRRPSPSSGPRSRWRRTGEVGWRGRCARQPPCDRPVRTTRRRSTCTSTTWRAPWCWRGAAASTVRSTWRPTDGSPAIRCAPWPASLVCACPTRWSSGSRGPAGSWGCRRRRPDCCRTRSIRGSSPTTG